MATIDVGSAASSSATYGAYSFLDDANPANDTGTIDHVEAYTSNYMSKNMRFCVCSKSGDNYTTRGGDYVEVTPSSGFDEWDAPGDFTAFDVNSGDYACFSDVGFPPQIQLHYYANTGTTVYQNSGQIPLSSATFSSFGSDSACSLYMTGTTGGEPPSTIKRRLLMGVGI